MVSLQNGKLPKLWAQFSAETVEEIMRLMNLPGATASFAIRPESNLLLAGLIGANTVEVTLYPWRIVVNPTERGAKARILFSMETNEQLEQLRQATNELSANLAWLDARPGLDIADIGASLNLDESDHHLGEIFVEVTGGSGACDYAKEAIDDVEAALIGRVKYFPADTVTFLSEAFAQIEILGDKLFRTLLDKESPQSETGLREGAF